LHQFSCIKNHTISQIMKRKYIMLLIFILTGLMTTVLHAQNNKTEKIYFKFGPKFGLDFNTNTDNFPESIEASTGHLNGNYQIGGFMQLGKRVYFQPEFHYAVHKYPVGDSLSSIEQFKVPVHVGVKFLDIGLLSLHLSGGAMYTHNKEEAFFFDKARVEYQVGAGIDLFDFITTDLRYGFKHGKSLDEQITDFRNNGGVINFTVGLKL